MCPIVEFPRSSFVEFDVSIPTPTTSNEHGAISTSFRFNYEFKFVIVK